MRKSTTSVTALHLILEAEPCINVIGQVRGAVYPVPGFDFYPRAANAPSPPLSLHLQPTIIGTDVVTREVAVLNPSYPRDLLPDFWLDGSTLRGQVIVFDSSGAFNGGPSGACQLLPPLAAGSYELDLQLIVITFGYEVQATQRITGTFTVGPAQPIPVDSPVALLILALGLVAIPLLRVGSAKSR